MRKVLPPIATVVVVAVAVYQLREQGRLWLCSCGYVLPWSGEYWGPNTSQHLLDPVNFTHVLHGFVLCGMLAWTGRWLSPAWRLWLAVSVEVLWEIVENSAFVIERYREGTAALGYRGDTIVNSMGDLLACGLGFVVARRLGFRRTLALFLATEAVLALWIRDGLLLNVLMLVYPIHAVEAWQAAGKPVV